MPTAREGSQCQQPAGKREGLRQAMLARMLPAPWPSSQSGQAHPSPPMPSSIGMSCLPPRPPVPHPPHPAHPILSHPTHRHSQASCAFQATRRSQRRSSRSDRKRWREAHSPVCTTRLKPASTAAARCSAVLACRHRGYDGGTGGRGGRVSCRGGRVKLIAAFVTAPGLPKRSWAAAAEGTARHPGVHSGAGPALWRRHSGAP